MKTDHELRQDVNDELEWEPSVHANEIDVDATNGVVTLFGSVCSHGEKLSAERAARRVRGVESLVSDLKVSLKQTHFRSDDDIRHSVQTVLEWRASLSGNHITVQVEDGWVTLSGSVKWQHQRLAAVDGVRNLTAVTGVTDDIIVEPSLSASTVKADIEGALQRIARTDANKISVEVDGSDVTLTGTVHSLAEREAATDAVWAAPGVTGVVDKMTLAY